jgi:hypothetical protein
MGRCPVRSIFPEAIKLLEEKQHQLESVLLYRSVPNTNRPSFMFDKIMPLSDAVEGYEIFDKMLAQKVVFEIKPVSTI